MNRQELIAQIKDKQSFLCVGLDTDVNKMPASLIEEMKEKYGEEEWLFPAIWEFNARIIDATAPIVWPTSPTSLSMRPTASTV